MKPRYYLVALGGFLLLSAAAGWLLGRFAPRPPQRRASPSATTLPAPPPPVIGRYYSVDNEDGGYRIIQVLDVSPGSIDVRLYGNHFPSRPASIDVAKLTLEPSPGYAGPGFERLSVTPLMFAAWEPIPVPAKAS